ncbi:hypothetical protein [[Limnothrix rosea] IAM M-220]|uniref:hypothetical protein n=1 Tax=[Limnothrix rosea] IAM M-220 TaxID=454133 RepID=UPI00095CCCA5|nr:hypothetical protein [[Limnothrix rosea] IAM M-220]OKH19428.1 hypothetical protein NIES208_02640 [[Limnothrix rosea] IAM M-220]
MNKVTLICTAIAGSLFVSINRVKAQTFDALPFCATHTTAEHYDSHLSLNNSDVKVALCSEGSIDPAGYCYYTPEKFFILVNDKSNGRTIKLEEVQYDVVQSSSVHIFKSSVDEFTYQVAASSVYTANPWTSFSIFKNGQKTFHNIRYGHEYGLVGDC